MTQTKLYIKFILISLFLVSCSDNDSNLNDPNKDKIDVAFNLQLPAKSSALRSASLADFDENYIKTIDILVFDSNDNYSYTAYSNTISAGGGTSSQQFSAKLVSGQYNLVVLANARSAIAAQYSSGIQAGTSRSTVMQHLKMTNSDSWVTDTSNPLYMPIPMWGETGLMSVTGTTTNISVNMVRMLAKINVIVEPTASSNFSLQSVHLYNHNDQGQIIPSTTSGYWDAVNKVALIPTIPSSAAVTSSPLIYSGSSITTAGVSSIGAIYAFEAVAGSSSSLESNACLVVGGTYTDGNMYYYRVDYIDDSSNYISLLRNHQYNVNIQSVSGPGYATPQLALMSKPINFGVSIVTWSDGHFSNVVFDGEYMLAVSQGEFTFSLDAQGSSSTSNKATISTDYPQGWTVSQIVDQNNNPLTWLQTSGNYTAINAKDVLTISATQNTTGNNRTGYIYIQAGRLSYVITVIQTNTSVLQISIADNSNNVIQELIFPSGIYQSITPKGFNVNWLPATSQCNVSLNSVGTNPPFNFGSGTMTSGSLAGINGVYTYNNIQPAAMTPAEVSSSPFLEKVSQGIFTVSNGVSYQSANLFIRQINYALVPTVQASYNMDGGQYSLNVKSNAAWTASITSNSSGVLTALNTTSGAGNTTSGEQVNFTTYNDKTNPTKFIGSATITFTSPQNLFAPVNVTINCINGTIVTTSNSYIVAPGAAPLLIPVTQANLSLLGTQIGASDVVTANLVWTDNASGMSASSNIRSIAVVGTGSSAYLAVVPGSGIGNAVISASVNSTIVWSWHIWVTGYDPSLAANQNSLGGYTLMSLNLGALNSTKGNSGNYGLTYQWGRKDPMFNSASANTVYNASASGIGYSTNTVSTSANALQYSVRNPMVFITENVFTQTWNGSNGASSWGPTTKTVYDPCPPGWRVPPKDIWSSLTLSNFPATGDGGRTHTTGGYFPYTGYVNALSSVLPPVGIASGVSGNYLTATYSSSGKASHMNFDAALIILLDVSDNDYKGYSVRCVKYP